jgi:hypothetical protein
LLQEERIDRIQSTDRIAAFVNQTGLGGAYDAAANIQTTFPWRYGRNRRRRSPRSKLAVGTMRREAPMATGSETPGAVKGGSTGRGYYTRLKIDPTPRPSWARLRHLIYGYLPTTSSA